VPCIDVPSMKTSILSLDLMDSHYDALMVMHIAYWASLVPRCDDLIIDLATFGDIVYVSWWFSSGCFVLL
jgi:hypothetical protein